MHGLGGMNYSRKEKWTKEERDRADRMVREIGCICCWLAFGKKSLFAERDHLLSGGKRMGHWYTIPLCFKHHRVRNQGGLWTSVADGSKAFTRVHGSRIDLWLKVQHALGLSDELPSTKVYPRRVA